MTTVSRIDFSAPDWDDLVLDSPEATVFHTSAWSRVIAETYGFRPVPLSLEDGHNEVVGLLPLFQANSPLIGRRIISLPCTNAAGPVCRAGVSSAALVSAAVDLANQEQCRYLEIRAQSEHDLSNLGDLVRLDYYGSFLLDLDRDLGSLRNDFDKRVRRGIVKAGKSGVTVRFGTFPHDLRQFYRLNLITRRKHGVPPQPYRFFDRIWNIMRTVADVELLIADVDGRAVAGLVVLGFRGTATYAYGASDPRYLSYSPNHALFERAIGWAVERGYRRFDFGRTAPDNRGLMEFKRQWAARFIPLPYYYWPAPGGFVAESEAGIKHRVATALWRRLPLPLTALLGPALFRHVV